MRHEFAPQPHPSQTGRNVLVTRLDGIGELLLAGPAIRAVAAQARNVSLLCNARSADAAQYLPGVDEVIIWDAEVGLDDHTRSRHQSDYERLVALLSMRNIDQALIFTSKNESPNAVAELCKTAGIPEIAGISSADDVALNLQITHVPDCHEVERCLTLAETAGFEPSRNTSLFVDVPSPDFALPDRFVVVHPGSLPPARQWSSNNYHDVVAELVEEHQTVIVTGTASERARCHEVIGDIASVIDFSGCTDFGELSAIFNSAEVVVTGNSGPSHLAAAVHTPVVTLFAPTMSAEQWGPWGVPTVVLGDQDIPCASCSMSVCPLKDHPCLDIVTPDMVVQSVKMLEAVSPHHSKI